MSEEASSARADDIEKLCAAIDAGDVAYVQDVIIKHPELGSVDCGYGETPLHVACYAKQGAIIGILLNVSDVNAQADNGRTPLHCSVHDGDATTPAIVLGLIQEGANPNVKDHAGFTPEMWAKSEMSDGLKETLEELRRPAQSTESALHIMEKIARRNGHPVIQNAASLLREQVRESNKMPDGDQNGMKVTRMPGFWSQIFFWLKDKKRGN